MVKVVLDVVVLVVVVVVVIVMEDFGGSLCDRDHGGGQGWASVIFKRKFHSFHSFPLFIKECSVLSVLSRSL